TLRETAGAQTIRSSRRDVKHTTIVSRRRYKSVVSAHPSRRVRKTLNARRHAESEKKGLERGAPSLASANVVRGYGSMVSVYAPRAAAGVPVTNTRTHCVVAGVNDSTPGVAEPAELANTAPLN